MRKRLFNQQSEPRSREAQKTWRLSVKAKIMMALLALMLIPQGVWAQTYYDLWIGTTRMSSQYTDVSQALLDNNRGSDIEIGSGGSMTFDAATSKLVMNNVKLKCMIQSDLPELIVEFSGVCELGASKGGYDGYFMSTNSTSQITFKGVGSNSTLDLHGGSSHAVVEGFGLVSYDGAYYVYTEPITYNTTSSSGQYESRFGQVQNLTITTKPHYLLWLDNTQVSDDNKGNILNDGSASASYDDVENVLTLDNCSFGTQDGIMSGLNSLTISLKGNNSISAAYHSGFNPLYSTVSGASLIIEKAAGENECSLVLNTYAINVPTDNTPVVKGFGTVTYDGLVCETMFGTGTTLADPATYGATVSTGYQLWVGGKQVTTANAADILNDYDPTAAASSPIRASYVNATKTLTLTGIASGASTAQISVNGTSAIKSGLDNLNVVLKDAFRIDCNGSSDCAFEGTLSGAKVTFKPTSATSGSLVINSSDFFNNIEPVYQDGLAFFRPNIKSNSSPIIMQSPWSGEGTANSPFLIKTPTDLVTLATYVNDNGYLMNQYFKLYDNIDCRSLSSFSSIGKRIDNWTIYSFEGTFDGNNNKTIVNLTSPYGLFAHVGGSGIITDLTLENCIVNGVLSGVGATSTNPAESAGGVVAEFRSTGKIEKCHVVGGSVSGGSNDKIYFVGGIVGVLNSGTIDQCTVENVTISEPDASRTIRQSVGGIVGTSDGGAISNCSVTINNGTSKITNFTTTAPEVYAGAIIGEGRSKVTLTNNTYSSGVEVQTQKGPAPDDAKSGNIQRGTGEADSESNWDVFTSDGAVLAGVQKVKLTVDSKGTGSISGYYRVNSNEYYSLPSCSLVVRGTPNADYDLPLLTLKRDNGVAWQVFYPDNTIQGTGYVDWSFNMPNSEVEADVKFGFDLSNANRIFTIDPITYNSTSAASITAIKTKATSTSTNEFTLTVSNNDFTVTGYQDDKGAALTGAPSDVGNYNVVVSGTGYNSGTVTIPFEITPQAATITATDQKVTYDGNPQALSASASSGVAVVTYYNSEDDRTNASGGFTKAPTDAKTYYVSVTQGNANYTSTAKNVTFTIDPLTATLNWTNTVFTYDGTAHVPTATVTNLIGKDACDVTVTGAETNASATSYTATATALSNNNYALPSGVTQTFTINPLAATPDVALTIPTSYVYDGTAKTPAVAVSVSGVALTTDDYSVAYTDNINAGRAAAKATVTLKRNYSGSKVETFDINPLTATLSWGNTTFVYNGTAQAPTATVTNLVGTDVCNVTVGGAETAAGSYTATATALSNANYQLPASPTTTFTILDRTATIDFGDRTFKTYYDANETFIVPDGTTAYIVTGVSGNAVTIQKVSYIKAGVPVLLESTPGSTVAKNVSETFTGNLLKYAAAATPATEKHYLLYKNEFVRASGTISNKVYLDLAGYSGGARSLVIGDGTTAIEGIAIDDGDAKWYDMQGRRINKPTKAGLYIKDGQKVVVKTRY